MAVNSAETFESLKCRRRLLEALAQLLCQLKETGNGLAAARNLVRPSQQFDGALIESLTQEIDQYESGDTQLLLHRLDELERVLEKASTVLYRVIRLDDARFLHDYQATDKDRERFSQLQAKLSLFTRQVQHSLAIRIVLKRRGVQLERSKLALEQEALADELKLIRARERRQQRRLRNHILEMLSDNDQLLRISGRNDQVQSVLAKNIERLRAALALLDSGGSVNELPELVEQIEYAVLPDGFAKQVLPEQPAAVLQTDREAPAVGESATGEPDVMVAADAVAKPHSLWARLGIWVSTSWDVSWADTKYYRR